MSTSFKFLDAIFAANITFQLVSDVVAGKIVQILGQSVSVSVIFFPFTFIISDIVTEVYGYKAARKMLLVTLICSIIAGFLYQIAIRIPSASFFEFGSSYADVLGVVPRILLAGWIAVYVGDLANNYVLARIKLITKGSHLWLRTISSTVVGQGLNTVLFYTIGLYALLPGHLLLQGILSAWGMKVIVEMVMTPYVYVLTHILKKQEGVDTYDNWLISKSKC